MYAHIRVITKHKKYHPPAIREVKLYQHVKDRISRQSLKEYSQFSEQPQVCECKSRDKKKHSIAVQQNANTLLIDC